MKKTSDTDSGPATCNKIPFYRDAKTWQWGWVTKGMDRMCLIPRNNGWNIYLHRYNGPDAEGVLHDHKWRSLSILLRGWLIETRLKVKPHPIVGKMAGNIRDKIQPRIYYRAAEHIHNISRGSWSQGVLPITLFITGPKRRDWYFWRPITMMGNTIIWDKITHKEHEASRDKDE